MKILSPRGGIVNVAVANPLKLKSIDGYVGSVEHDSFIVGSLTGMTTFFENRPGKIRQICIKPFLHSWPRFCAVLGQVFGAEVLHFRSWKDGVVFGTGMFGGRGPRVHPQRKNKSHAPILGGNLPNGEASQFCIWIP